MTATTKSKNYFIQSVSIWCPLNNFVAFCPLHSEGLYSSVAERWSCKPKVMSSILIGGILFGQKCHSQIVGKRFCPRRYSNTQPSDLESDALPLRHGVKLC